MKKYELLKDDTKIVNGKTLYRIRALVAISLTVAAGDLGGYVESEKNLSHDGNAWVYGNARVYGDARVYKSPDVQWFSNVGSENGTLTVFRAKDGDLFVTRGCFSGTLAEFEAAVNEKHGDSKIGKHYRLLIEAIKVWFARSSAMAMSEDFQLEPSSDDDEFEQVLKIFEASYSRIAKEKGEKTIFFVLFVFATVGMLYMSWKD